MRAYLIGLTGPYKGRTFWLDKDRVLVGRDAAICDLVLDQATISKQHAAIETDRDGVVTITDLDSSFGTFVNDASIKRHELGDGARVGFGPNSLIAFSFHLAEQRNEGKGYARTPQELKSQLLEAAQRASQRRQESPVPPPTSSLPGAAPDVVRIGRAPDNDLVLNGPGVSRHHATLTWDGSPQPIIADLGSTNGTFVGGDLLREKRRLEPLDLVFLGGFLLRAKGRAIEHHDLSASRLCAEGITKEVPGKTIIRDISLAIYPREFVGLMGPSGCGKSTLMDALNGLRPATRGSVSLNELDLYSNFHAIRHSIGYVPQRDILHDSLSAKRTLYFAARLRLPETTATGDLMGVVNEVLETVGLGQQAETPFRQLSGGQQKRLSLGLELITKPNFLFLDEPTSPLDPETTEDMMLLFRELADQGRIVVMVTHKFEKMNEMHHIVILTRSGTLAFFGPPREALEYFGCAEPSDIYRKLSRRDPEEVSRAFRETKYYQDYVGSRIAESRRLQSDGSLVASAAPEASAQKRLFGFGQWATLARRYFEIKLNDRRNTGLLLVQAPVIAILLAVITGDSLNDGKTLFIAAVIAIWFGANNAIREIVAEAQIYSRERLGNLKIPSYVLSKFAVLSVIGLVQTGLFVGILVWSGRLRGADFFTLSSILYLTSLGGIATALFFSAIVRSTEKAMSVLPLLLIPQLLLSGFLKPIDDLYVNAQTGRATTVAEYTKFRESAPTTRPTGPIQKYEGLGVAWPLSTPVLARWSIDALVHAVSVHDLKARDALAAQMTVAEYDSVLRRRPEAEIARSYRLRFSFDMVLLGGFSVLFLLLTMWALKRKDVL